MSRKSCLITSLVSGASIVILALILGNMIGSSMDRTFDRVGSPAPSDTANASADDPNPDRIGTPAHRPSPDDDAAFDSNTAADNALDSVENAVAVDSNAIENAAEPTATDTQPGDLAEEGVGAFKDLGDMEVDNWYNVEFFVAPDNPETTAAEELADVSEGVELTRAQPVYVAPIMRVTMLPDPNFEIRQKGDAIRTTGRDRSASWQWDVKPLTGGDRTLFAKVEVLKRLPDGTFETTETKTRRVAFSVKVGTWKGLLIALKNASTLGDVLGTLFSSWRGALVALGLLVGAASGVWVAIKNWGKKE